VEDSNSTRVKGLLVAGGGSFLLPGYKGGVSFLNKRGCEKVFPTDPVHGKWGQTTNSVDCHRGTGICFFSVWKYYDDQSGMWNPVIEKRLPDCLYYCVADGLDDSPSCSSTDVLSDDLGTPICHKHGVGAVHSVVVGNTDPVDPSQFDLLLVFTGGAQFIGGESSMKKLRLRVTGHGDSRQVKVLRSRPFATDLFTKLPAPGHDVGGDHAWVDQTKKWVWITTFRTAKPGVHLVDYENGRLKNSVTGMSDYIANNYAYSAGVHGVGTLGQKGSYLAVATSACAHVELCAPVPWVAGHGAKGIMFIIDLSEIQPMNQTHQHAQRVAND